MKTVGIIAEFNPFHNGHKYLIETSKKELNADYCVVVMSGSFTQRGTPAFMYKYDRVRAALECGADLVLELPVSYSTASAECFAFGGVSILDSLGIIDCISFGSECGDVELLTKCASDISKLTVDQSAELKSYLSKGYSFPAARALLFPEYSDILESPNNILAVEYIKALIQLDSNIIAYTTKRVGAGYHDLFNEDYSSAEGIRNLIGNLDNTSLLETSLKGIPTNIYEIYKDGFGKIWPIDINDYTELIKYILISKDEDSLSLYQDMNIDIAHRFKKNNPSQESISDYLLSIKTKELTYTRLNRCLLHCLLEMRDLTRNNDNSLKPCPYTRILGFKKEASELMHNIVRSSSIPLVNKAADASSVLSESAFPFYDYNKKADKIYDLIVEKKYGTHLKDGCLISPIII